jgi:hypothetical protein
VLGSEGIRCGVSHATLKDPCRTEECETEDE